MTLSANDIKALIATFQESDWDEMAVTADGVSVVISRSGVSEWATVPQQGAERSSSGGQSAPGRTSEASGERAEATASATPVAAPSRPRPVAKSIANHRVTSPTIGLFWRSPQPGSPPFVEVGQRVAADDTVAVIEVMKLMNQVKADAAGTVISIEPENGAMVEHGDTLVVIELDA